MTNKMKKFSRAYVRSADQWMLSGIVIPWSLYYGLDLGLDLIAILSLTLDFDWGLDLNQLGLDCFHIFWLDFGLFRPLIVRRNCRGDTKVEKRDGRGRGRTRRARLTDEPLTSRRPRWLRSFHVIHSGQKSISRCNMDIRQLCCIHTWTQATDDTNGGDGKVEKVE